MTVLDRISLSALPRELASLIDGPPPSYRKLYNLALDARIPANLADGRWTVERTDLPAIMTVLGLRTKADIPAKARKAAVARQPVAA